ncbi:protein phosphatase 1 regulatory subunit 3C-like [Coregonus clupeaformis]|uniref:protein phosphatase 1 regulatory subunit 3C-like n=1 Tax=Coregonus clupeaformis TaxID=59861 RepID=UPI001E1C8EC7|nr:protein phosphatase 1 regulatory subunit 3C-like [Coregonus clupeaformis]
MFGDQSMPQSVGTLDIAISLCWSQCPPLCQLFCLSSLKHPRPWIRAPVPEQLSQSSLSPTPLTPDRPVPLKETGEDEVKAKRKHVVFMDSKGLSLTSVNIFSEMEDVPTAITPRESRGHDRGGFKAVCIRITFDSWHSHQDVPCAFLKERYGVPDTDIFDITLPKLRDENIEFCVSYLPDRYSTPFWDNNNGQNYSIFVSDKPEAPWGIIWTIERLH